MKISQTSAYALHALMYMARHVTQLPIASRSIARAEGIPVGYLAKVLQQLARAGYVRAVKGRDRGYVFARPPEEISLLELFETLEGEPLFDDCPLRHCACDGTSDNCYIFAQWLAATRRMRDLLSATTIASAAWHHPEHRCDAPANLITTEGVE
jgi:Rrf2 family protein